MALTTPAAAIAQLNANNLYDANESASEARLYIEAARALLGGLLPKRSQQGRGGTQYEYDPKTLERLLTKAEQWLSRFGGGAGGAGAVKYANFSNFRE